MVSDCGHRSRKDEQMTPVQELVLFKTAKGEPTIELSALVEAVQKLAKFDETEVLALASRDGLVSVLGVEPHSSAEIPDLGSWDDLKPAPTKRLSDAEYRTLLKK
jgi:hypothetical protein